MKSLEDLQNILNQKDAEVRALKDKVAAALKNFEGSGLKVEMRNGKVYVSMDEKLLFASGKWEVQGDGKAALKELAGILETENSINVLIEGHTDNVPFNGNGQVKDNWDLSVMRATAVVKLILSYGTTIDPQRISASGRGELPKPPRPALKTAAPKSSSPPNSTNCSKSSTTIKLAAILRHPQCGRCTPITGADTPVSSHITLPGFCQ